MASKRLDQLYVAKAELDRSQRAELRRILNLALSDFLADIAASDAFSDTRFVRRLEKTAKREKIGVLALAERLL